MESSEPKVAGAEPVAQRMEETSRRCLTWNVRGGIVCCGFQTMRCSAPRRPHAGAVIVTLPAPTGQMALPESRPLPYFTRFFGKDKADHIVPARLIRRLRAGNPDCRENLQCICGTCHGYKLQADHKLCLGDKVGYLQILRTHHFDVARVERALAMYGL